MDGLLVLHKPKGMVCNHLLNRIKRMCPKVKVGHVGTLDPLAQGLLPVLLGRATRLQDYLLNSEKSYECEVTLGYETATLDAEGDVVKRQDLVAFDEATLNFAKNSLLGGQMQVPPIYSAVKLAGRPLYSYARAKAGCSFDISKLQRAIEIFHLDIVDWGSDKIRFRVECSKGTYVRVLAKDLAQKTGNLGTVTTLIRTSCSGYTLDEAVTLAELEQEFSATSTIENKIIPLSEIRLPLSHWRCLNAIQENKLLAGQTISFDSFLSLGDKETKASADDAQTSWENAVLLSDHMGRVIGLGSVVSASDFVSKKLDGVSNSKNLTIKLLRSLR